MLSREPNVYLHLIRHGSTVAIEQDLYSGVGNISLSKKGKKEVLKHQKKGGYPASVDLFYSGQLARCIETLHLIYGEDVSYQTIGELNEQHLGTLDLKSFEAIKTSKRYLPWLLDQTGDVPCPEGESLNQFKMRVKLGYHFLRGYLRKKATEPRVYHVVLVTHGSVIAILMGSLLPNFKTRKNWIPAPGRGYTLYFKGETLEKHEEL